MRGGFRTAAGREAQRPARWAKHEAWAPTPAGAKAEAEDARTRRPAADAATARMAVGCLRTLLLGVRSSRCAVRVRGSSVRDALAPGFDVCVERRAELFPREMRQRFGNSREHAFDNTFLGTYVKRLEMEKLKFSFRPFAYYLSRHEM